MRRLLFAAAVLAGSCGVLWVDSVRRRRAIPSSLSHLRVGRVWEYDVTPGEGLERTEVLESWELADGRQAFRVEYRRDETVIEAVFTDDRQGRLIQLSQQGQSGGAATFDPPLIGIGRLRLGEVWSTSAAMILPSMFRAASSTEVSGEVVGLESVTVSAGTFEAFRIDHVTNGRSCTAWHVPGIGMVREVAEDQELTLRRISDPSRSEV